MHDLQSQHQPHSGRFLQNLCFTQLLGTFQFLIIQQQEQDLPWRFAANNIYAAYVV